MSNKHAVEYSMRRRDVFRDVERWSTLRVVLPELEQSIIEYERNLNMDKVWGLQDRLSFGKHEGKTIEEVIEVDPEYVLDYLVEQLLFVLDDEAEEALEAAFAD